VPPSAAPGSPTDWMNRANGKLALARQALPPGGYWEDLSYMAQQACELAIKSVYQYHGWKFAFVHDIRFLLDGLENQGLPVPAEVRTAESTSAFATHLRYPGSSGFTTEAEHRATVQCAETVIAWASKVIGV